MRQADCDLALAGTEHKARTDSGVEANIS